MDIVLLPPLCYLVGDKKGRHNWPSSNATISREMGLSGPSENHLPSADIADSQRSWSLLWLASQRSRLLQAVKCMFCNRKARDRDVLMLRKHGDLCKYMYRRVSPEGSKGNLAEGCDMAGGGPRAEGSARESQGQAVAADSVADTERGGIILQRCAISSLQPLGFLPIHNTYQPATLERTLASR